MKWLITKVHDVFGEEAGERNTEKAKDLPYAFRLYDDDGILYFDGRSDDRDSEDAFAPLDWAEPNYGCTRIDYLQDDGTWETL